MPAAVGTKESVGYTPLPNTCSVEVNAAVPEHVASSGPKRLKVMVPVGASPPASVAVSVTDPPTATDGDAAVVRVGVMRPVTTTTTDSARSVQIEPTALLLASPL